MKDRISPFNPFFALSLIPLIGYVFILVGAGKSIMPIFYIFGGLLSLGMVLELTREE